MYTVYQIAKWFLNKENNKTSAKKLQKLCWYAYSWYIALTYDPEVKTFEYLFNEEPEAWVHGPVFRCLFEDYKYNNYEKVKTSKDITNKEDLDFLEDVYDVYGGLSGFDLESLTHREMPWKRARKDLGILESSTNKIQIKDIIDEYLPRILNENG